MKNRQDLGEEGQDYLVWCVRYLKVNRTHNFLTLPSALYAVDIWPVLKFTLVKVAFHESNHGLCSYSGTNGIDSRPMNVTQTKEDHPLSAERLTLPDFYEI